MLFIGDDRAEDHHDVEVQDEQGRVLRRARLREGIEGIAAFGELVGRFLPADGEADVLVCIEVDRGPWVNALIAAGYRVFGVDPRQAHRHREILSSSGAKSDKGDAHALADMVCVRRHQLLEAGGDSEVSAAVKVITRAHQTMIWDRTRHMLRLRAALREYFPAILLICSELDLSLTSRPILALLAKAPDPVSAAKLTPRQILPMLKGHRNKEDRAARIQQILRGEHLGQPPVVTAAYAASVRSSVAVLNAVIDEIASLEEEVKTHFGRHPDADIISSQPGLGPVLGARVLAEFGDAPGRYHSAKARKNYAGTSPITKQSGKTRIVAARYVHNDRLVDALHQQASCALLHHSDAKAYYDQLRARGLKHNPALRQLANRLVGILHGCLTHGTQYDKAIAWAHRQPSPLDNQRPGMSDEPFTSPGVSRTGSCSACCGVTMSLHKLTAGSGYDYLTRQVAVQDTTEKGHVGLASYYTERGETPGIWIGSGCVDVGAGFPDSMVTAEQMQALFGAGMHPLGPEILRNLDPSVPQAVADQAMRLGTPFKLSGRVDPFRIEVARRIEELNKSRGLKRDAPVSVDDRARIRTAVAREVFVAEFGREPLDERELAGTIARHSRPAATAVAGFDLTFSPPKSVSTLWAVADQQTAARIEVAHNQAVRQALQFIEQNLLYSREGTRGVRQVDVTGMVAAAFTHRDSRAGDPDLHTHVAVANKVRTLGSGKWLSIDGRVLYRGAVSASEHYNTALVKLLEREGLRFEDRTTAGGGRPVREIAGVSAELNQRWSSRRASIESRRAVLVAGFQRAHGRPPSVVEAVKLAQQATLETREAKHEPRTLAEQRQAWRAQAIQVLGSAGALRRMVEHATGATGRPDLVRADAAWFEHAADRIVAVVEARGATWQVHHMRAEALRMVRRTDVPLERLDAAVELLVAGATDRCVPLVRPDMGITEPGPLLRADGSSVYTVAGSQLFTSARVVAAEQLLVDLAGRTGGRRADPEHVTQALEAAERTGRPLNLGQAELVSGMATSGRPLQLAIAPAGAGKTTAMQALAQAWENLDGNVLGLAPSAAAAAQLRDQTGATTETLAKLAWHLTHTPAELPDWAQRVGAGSLMLIDEAGMADTLSLAQVTSWAVGRGASVRLIGDDQQLAAIGAGGVLRDIETTHGSVRLTELMRFNDPAEAAASLALRDGNAAGLGFYLDNQRVHVGDLVTMTEQAFDAWRADVDAGRDSIMLAPTRQLVAELNQRARTHRLGQLPAATPIGTETALADGCAASVGDTVITRTNDRRLRISRTDWVKNGDRWTIRHITDHGDLHVQHTDTRRLVVLPHDYATTSVELGYATTVHSAQGVSVDTMHGVAAGDESRQRFYTMMTRGRHANHVWLQVVGDGDDDNLIRPEGITPPTPTDVLEAILARDESQASATSLLREQADPRLLLGDATQQYVDGLYAAAEHHLGTDQVAALDQRADQLLPGIGDSPAWPTLRAHLLLLGAQGVDPLDRLTDAIEPRPLAGAHDIAAVLSWRLDDTGLRNTRPGPLPWLPGIPTALADDPTFETWLAQRAALVNDLAGEVRNQTLTETSRPPWVPEGNRRPGPDVIADVELWRAAMQIRPTDLRPTGPAQLSKAAINWQQQLNQLIWQGQAPAMAEWGDLLTGISPAIAADDYLPQLADHLAGLARHRNDAASLLRGAAAEGPLPDDHAAAALWWRIQRVIPTNESASDGDETPGGWTAQLLRLVGDETAERLTTSPYWSALVQQVDEALERGWQLQGLLDPPADSSSDDPGFALLHRITILTSRPAEPFDDPALAPPDDLTEGWQPPADESHRVPIVGRAEAYDRIVPEDVHDPEAELGLAALIRTAMGAPEPTNADTAHQFERADAWAASPVSRERLLQINKWTQDFYTTRFADSWAQAHLTERFGADLTGHQLVQPGYAPGGWTTLTAHLRKRGVSDTEMLCAGVARTATTGRLIDQFRDRLTFPITTPVGEILGFVARRNPAAGDEATAGPKYLNTGQTPLFYKGDQFYGTPRPGTTPVIVEGPMDAIAVTLGSHGRYTGLAPLGTSLTDQQAAILAGHADVVIATDADLAGHVAAERDYWQLTPYGIGPRRAVFPEGTDPADHLVTHGVDALATTLDHAKPMAEIMINERIRNLPPDQALDQATKIAAARPPRFWDGDSEMIAARLEAPMTTVREALARNVRTWNQDPRHVARNILLNTTAVRRRLEAASRESRWTQLANSVDPRLSQEPDWPSLERTLQHAHQLGYDVDTAVRFLATPDQASHAPARDLRARIITTLSLNNQPQPAKHDTHPGPGRPPVPAPQRPTHSPSAPRPR